MAKLNLLKKTFISVGALFLLLSTNYFASGSVYAAATNQPAQSQIVSITEAEQKIDRMIALAESLQGKVTYKYGVNDPKDLIFDCSSFTKYIFASEGINLKWGSAAQSKQGITVAKSNLKKGDLVFFSTGTPGKIGHVGIYVGNGKYIHNTIGKNINGVIISDINKSTRFITATRILY